MYNLLIVDDDISSLIFFKKLILQTRQCNVLTAQNGLVGLRILEDEKIDGVFMDISMPVMNGLEAIEAIRNNPHFFKMPIMVLSAVVDRIKIEQALKLNVFDYLLKPQDNKEIVKRIKRFLSFIDEKKTV